MYKKKYFEINFLLIWLQIIVSISGLLLLLLAFHSSIYSFSKRIGQIHELYVQSVYRRNV